MQASNNPFSAPFEVFGNESSRFLSDGVNESAYKAFITRLEEPFEASGCVVLLRSPRAGYGKTALLQRARRKLSKTHLFMPFSLLSGHQFDSGQLLEDILTELSQQLPEGGGLTAIDYVSRRILAKGLDPMIASGEIHSQNKEEALDAIRKSPEQTFDFHDDDAATAQWIRDNFETVGSRLATELSVASKASLREVAYWVELFYRYASTLPTSVARNGQLFETVFGGQERRGAAYNERVMGLIRLLNIVTRPVLVLDDTEGLSGLPAASLEVVSGLVSLSQACKGTSVVLCMNSDIWESGVAPRLPGGLKDRVMDKIVDLKPLSKDQARELIRFHAGNSAGAWIDDIELGDGVLYSRGVLKLASEVWRDRVITPEPVEVATVAEVAESTHSKPLDEEPAPNRDTLPEPPESFPTSSSAEEVDVANQEISELLSTNVGPSAVAGSLAVATSQITSSTSEENQESSQNIGNEADQHEVAEALEPSAAPLSAEEPVVDAPGVTLTQEEPFVSEEVTTSAPAVEPSALSEAESSMKPAQETLLAAVAPANPVHVESPKPLSEDPAIELATESDFKASPFEAVIEAEDIVETNAPSPFSAEAILETESVVKLESFQAPTESEPEPLVSESVSPSMEAADSPFIGHDPAAGLPPVEAFEAAEASEPPLEACSVNPFADHEDFSPFNVAGQKPVEEQSAIPQPRPSAPEAFVPQVAPSPFTASTSDFSNPATPQQASPFQVAPQNQQASYQPLVSPELSRKDPRAFHVQSTVSQEGVQAPQQQTSSPFQVGQSSDAISSTPVEPAPTAPAAPLAENAPAPFANPFRNPFETGNTEPPKESAPLNAPVAPSAPFQEAPQNEQPVAQVFENPFMPVQEPVRHEPAPPVQEVIENPFMAAQTAQEFAPVSPNEPVHPVQNPFEAPRETPSNVAPPVEQAPAKSESNEEKRVEDLLEQFKNRYGRD